MKMCVANAAHRVRVSVLACTNASVCCCVCVCVFVEVVKCHMDMDWICLIPCVSMQYTHTLIITTWLQSILSCAYSFELWFFLAGAKFEMSEKRDTKKWSKYAESYDPIKIGSIDGKPFENHRIYLFSAPTHTKICCINLAVQELILLHTTTVWFEQSIPLINQMNGLSAFRNTRFSLDDYIWKRMRYNWTNINNLLETSDRFKLSTLLTSSSLLVCVVGNVASQISALRKNCSLSYRAWYCYGYFKAVCIHWVWIE